jgi:hypothetical protein
MCEPSLLESFFGLTRCMDTYRSISQISPCAWSKYKSVSLVSWSHGETGEMLLYWVNTLGTTQQWRLFHELPLDQTQWLLPYFHFFCVTPHRGMPHQEDCSSSIILLVGKSSASTSLLIPQWSPHHDLPSSLFPFSSCATPQVRHSLLALFISHLCHSTYKGSMEVSIVIHGLCLMSAVLVKQVLRMSLTSTSCT